MTGMSHDLSLPSAGEWPGHTLWAMACFPSASGHSISHVASFTKTCVGLVNFVLSTILCYNLI